MQSTKSDDVSREDGGTEVITGDPDFHFGFWGFACKVIKSQNPRMKVILLEQPGKAEMSFSPPSCLLQSAMSTAGLGLRV